MSFHVLTERKDKKNKGFILEMKILICDLETAVYHKMPSDFGEELPQSVLILDLQLVCNSKSLDEPFVVGGCGAKVQV